MFHSLKPCLMYLRGSKVIGIPSLSAHSLISSSLISSSSSKSGSLLVSEETLVLLSIEAKGCSALWVLLWLADWSTVCMSGCSAWPCWAVWSFCCCGTSTGVTAAVRSFCDGSTDVCWEAFWALFWLVCCCCKSVMAFWNSSSALGISCWIRSMIFSSSSFPFSLIPWMMNAVIFTSSFKSGLFSISFSKAVRCSFGIWFVRYASISSERSLEDRITSFRRRILDSSCSISRGCLTPSESSK